MKVGEGSDEVQAQAEAFSPVGIALARQPGHLEPPNGVFDDHAPRIAAKPPGLEAGQFFPVREGRATRSLVAAEQLPETEILRRAAGNLLARGDRAEIP